MTFIEIIYGIIFQPASTLKYLSGSKPLVLAVIAFLFTALWNMIINMGLNNARGFTASLPEGYIGVYLFIGLLISLAVLAGSAAIYNLLGELIYKQANGRGILTCLAFGFVPGILEPPLQYALTLLNFNYLNISISIMAFLWVMTLQIVGIREALVIQTSQALLLFVLPWLIFVLLIVALVMLVGMMVPGII